MILDNLGISNTQISSPYMQSLSSEKELILLPSKIENDLANGIMPDLSGINLEDALYLLERYGCQVEIFGSGAVLKQSIEKGKVFRRGAIIKLELA